MLSTLPHSLVLRSISWHMAMILFIVRHWLYMSVRNLWNVCAGTGESCTCRMSHRSWETSYSVRSDKLLCYQDYAYRMHHTMISVFLKDLCFHIKLVHHRTFIIKNRYGSEMQFRIFHVATLRSVFWPPLWSSGQSFLLQIQRSWVRFLALQDFLRSRGSRTGSTQPHEDNWMKK
jgi:hypothetical protein